MRKGIIYVYFNKAKYEKEGIEKYYVGQTIGTMEQRARKDGKGYRIFDETCNSKFARSIRKWGWDAFEGRVLEEVYEEDLNELEKFYIEYFDSFKNGYNSTLGGEGTRGLNPFVNKTEEEMEEIKEKMSKSQIIAQKKHWEDSKEREKMSEIQRKRCKDPKERKKMGEIQRKRYKDPKEREKQSIALRKHWENKNEREKMSEIQRERWKDTKLREKISKVRRKNWKDQEYREKQNIAQRKRWENTEEREKITGEKNGRAKSVYCNELDIIFSYAKLAEKYCINVLNSKISPIGSVCNGKMRYSGTYNGMKLTWNWTENLDKEMLNNAEYIDDKCYEEIINGNKKYLKNPEIKKMQNERLLFEKHGNTKKVYCKELNIVFSYMRLAAEYCKNVLNIKIGSISLTCNGKRKSTGTYNGKKLHWNWTKNLDKEILNNAEYIDRKKYEEIINAKK